jgi:hypothetical protein
MFFFVAVLICVRKCINRWETRRLEANFCTLPLERRNIQHSLESKIKWVNEVKCNQPKCWEKYLLLLLLLFNRPVETGREEEIRRRWVQGTYTAYSCEVYVPPFPTAYFRSK